MSSWWSLGEGVGQFGEELQMHEITCAFCLERGNFKTVFHKEKRKPNSSKILNFDTLECGNCKGYVMVLWSAGEHSLGFNNNIYDYKVLPWPIKLTSFPKHWPEEIGRYWLQAKKNLNEENWDAAALMARSALQIALRNQGAKGRTFKDEIEDLTLKKILPPIMKDWSGEVRELGNDVAHPVPGQDETDPNDARDVINFLDFILEYLYTLPHQIARFRKRKTSCETTSQK